MLRIFKRLMILSVLLLTGCSVEYKVTINNTNNIFESVSILENDKNKFNIKQESLHNVSFKDYLDTNLKWPLPVYDQDKANPLEPKKVIGVDYYNTTNISNDNVLGINYFYNHDFDMYKDTLILNKCYSFDLESNNNIIKFNTQDSFKCFNDYPLLDEIVFKVSTTCNIKNNNADNKKNNTLIYNINRNNIDKKISFELDCNEKKEKPNSIISLELIIIYFIFIGLIVILIKTIYEKKNKF